MTGSIKLFSFIQKVSQVIGVYPLQSNENGPSINSRNWIIIISLVLFALPSTAFFFSEAKSMLEYGISFYGASVAALFMCIYISMGGKMNNMRTFIENVERFVEESKMPTVLFSTCLKALFPQWFHYKYSLYVLFWQERNQSSHIEF